MFGLILMLAMLAALGVGLTALFGNALIAVVVAMVIGVSLAGIIGSSRPANQHLFTGAARR